MRVLRYAVISFAAAWLIGCSGEASINEEAIKREVRKVLAATETAWNEGDIRGYMEGYYKSDSLRFAGNGDVSYGWESVLERYKNAYPDKAAMGHLTFSDVDIDVIDSGAAIVFGRWKLGREAGDRSGLYTLLLYKTADGWRIVHDHSSSARED
jgi:ketosteroid isomerase-like protein